MIALVTCALSFLPVMIRNFSDTRIDVQLHYQDIPESLAFLLLSSFVLAIPLVLEFIMDIASAAMYPIYYGNILEHRFGHILLLLSLVLPIILFAVIANKNEIDVLLANCFISFCECLALTALFGKLQIFGLGECWKSWNSSIIVFLVFFVQLLANFQSTVVDRYIARWISFVLGITRILLVVWFGLPHFVEINDVLRRQKRNVSTNKFQCLMLMTLVFLYMLSRLFVNVYFLSTEAADISQILIVRISLLMLCAVGGAVLPGRMIRRGVVTLKVSH